jgi:putative N6-adenine-specific DNA methylase
VDELREWARAVSAVPGGAEVAGGPGLHQTLNLYLRTANRVLVRVASFEATEPEALAAGLARVPLNRFRLGEEPIRIEATARRSRLSNTRLLREAGARAWGVRVANAVRPEESGSDDSPDAQDLLVQIRIADDVCTVSVDSTGEILYRRGYRQEVSRAPLRETLAAGILRLATYRGDEPLWDPMCGSGTLAIEAALIALRRAPGRDRTFAFQRWPGHDAAAFEAMRAAAKAEERPAPACAIHASDLNAGALGTARRNARRAGVLDHLELFRGDVTHPSVLPTEPAGILVANPPYGKRVGEAGEVEPLYSALGALLCERLPRWRAAILVPEDVRIERLLALEVDDAFELVNGGIQCRLLVTRPHASR